MSTIQLNWRLVDVYRSSVRNKVIVGGRRIGKTEYLLAEIVKALQKPASVSWYVAPTYRQAKRIAWERLKSAIPKEYFLKPPNETDLQIWTTNGATLELKGADNPDSLRGVAVDDFFLDELDFWNDPESTYGAVLRPMLLTTKGRMVAAGSPNGFKLLKDFYDRGQNGQPGWQSWLFKTKDFVAPAGHIEAEEFELARQDMDERTFRQEWDAEFLMASGRVAYNWSNENVKPVTYDPNQDVYVSLDFNVTPAAAILAHVENNQIVHQFDEINMSDAWTQLVVDRIVQKLAAHNANIRFYGDPAGTHRSTQSHKTDWQLVEDTIRSKFGNKSSFHYSRNQIPERDKINALNGRICNSLGERRYFADRRCKQTIKDLEQCKALPAGQIDKSDSARTHWLDAAGYLCVTKWPIRSRDYREANVNF